jgi:hypothetical protein
LTAAQLLDLAAVAFKERDLGRPEDANRFFHEYGVGNTVETPVNPHERFSYYRDLLARLHSVDPAKFAAIHKGTPLYFLSWLAFDLHQFEGALHFLDASIEEDRRIAPDSWFDNPGPQILMLNAPVQAARRTVEMLALRVDQELNRFQSQYGVSFPREEFLRRFAGPMLRGGKASIIAAFYAFLPEFDDRSLEVQLAEFPCIRIVSAAVPPSLQRRATARDVAKAIVC